MEMVDTTENLSTLDSDPEREEMIICMAKAEKAGVVEWPSG